MKWLFLALAITLEISATMALRVSEGLRIKKWAAPILAGYILSFTMLSFSLQNGMPIGIAYGIWSAIGIAGTAIIARAAFNDPLTKTMGGGIVLVITGVLLVELGSH
ncbi:cation transporter [Paractinoplanes abujensis]|uniref:Small multidrug resistance pump n=1 Tax=Paractinoplanes abujensis TaxID=882441 RepID=A0A7W7G0P3_9ACTN|nr:multidrug efflux SMR transporter [Actinoplanes abujensis]MBB4691794.1 small multidrug resistance pump [Actinoplanes abujensis]GID16784.1 cation transporter [Actinoplanes abujensis]